MADAQIEKELNPDSSSSAVADAALAFTAARDQLGALEARLEALRAYVDGDAEKSLLWGPELEEARAAIIDELYGAFVAEYLKAAEVFAKDG